MATYVNDLRLKEIATGDESGTWGASTNTNLELIAEAFSFGTEAITTNADTHTTTIADGSTDPGRSIYLKYTGTLDSACTITIGPNTVSKLWFIENGTSGSQNIIISQGSGANVTVPAGEVKAIYSDGAGSGAAMVDAFANLKVSDAAQTNITSLGTLTTLTVDDITIDGSTISDSGDLTLDVGGDIILDANGRDIKFLQGGTQYMSIFNDVSNNAIINSIISDKDIIFSGIDGGASITALTLDMSDAGAATFNSSITVANTISISSSNTSAFIQASDNVFQLGTSSDDPVVFFENNAEKMRLTSGNLGIGDSSPVAKLTVKAASDTIRAESLATDAKNITMSYHDSNDQGQIFCGQDGVVDKNIVLRGHTLIFQRNGGTEAMRIDDSGNLLVGTTSTSPADGVSPSVLIGDSSDSSSGLVLSNSSHNWLLYNDSDGDFNIYDSDNNADRFTINSSGQHLQTPLGVTVPSFSFIGDTDTGMTRPTGDTLQFVTGGSEAMRINSSGRMFIGRTSALQSDNMLSVQGSGTGAGNAIMDVRNTSSSDTCGVIALSKASTTTDSSGRFIYFFANNFGTNMGAIAGNGSGNVAFVATSDERLKENVKPITGSLDKVLALNPVSFNWKENGEHIEAGFVAQEVEKVLPEYTVTDDDEIKTKNLTGGMTSGYIAVLTKAIQEQQAQIDALQSEINILKGE